MPAPRHTHPRAARAAPGQARHLAAQSARQPRRVPLYGRIGVAPRKPSLLRCANNRNVWRNLMHRFPHPYTGSDADSWFALLEGMAEPTHWAIEVAGAAVGGVGCMLGEGVYKRSAQFGYWLAEPLWGRGIMTAVVKAVVPCAMERLRAKPC
ncbi:MAG TPA: GNAT family N-acetyltransferase [Burkholderiales bacterium]|nr:GNAT family N-acetyltransferase [Burkholderiales bacterium]